MRHAAPLGKHLAGEGVVGNEVVNDAQAVQLDHAAVETLRHREPTSHRQRRSRPQWQAVSATPRTRTRAADYNNT